MSDIVKHNDGYRPRALFLKCKCGKRGWHTKNVDCIGARNIYNFAGGCDWMIAHQTCTVECDCPFSDLSIDSELLDHVKNCPRCLEYGW